MMIRDCKHLIKLQRIHTEQMHSKYAKVSFEETVKYPASTRRPGDVPWRFPKGPNVRDLQGTFRGLLGNQQKNGWFDEKKCFLDAIVFVYTSITDFCWKNKYSKVLNREIHGTSTGPSCRTSRGPDDGTFWGTFFQFNSEIY